VGVPVNFRLPKVWDKKARRDHRLAVGTKLSLYGKELEVRIAAMSGYILVDEDGGYYAIDSDYIEGGEA
jgi:hypothetical protein